MNVTLHCNSSDNVLKTEWTKDGIQVFIHSPLLKKNGTKRNFTSERMSVDPATPTILQISDVQVSDEGIYTCTATDYTEIKTKWNLTISSGHPSKLILISIGAISGTNFIIIIIIIILCISR